MLPFVVIAWKLDKQCIFCGTLAKAVKTFGGFSNEAVLHRKQLERTVALESRKPLSLTTAGPSLNTQNSKK